MPNASGPKGRTDLLSNLDGKIEIEHYKIHLGRHFFVEDYDNDVDVASPKYYLIIAPAATVQIHLFFNAYTDNTGIWRVFEGATVAGGNEGTPIAPLNNYRDSGLTTSLLVYKDPTVGADGTQISVMLVPAAGKREGAISQRTEELILKAGSKYLFKFTPTNNDTALTIHFNWYDLP